MEARSFCATAYLSHIHCLSVRLASHLMVTTFSVWGVTRSEVFSKLSDILNAGEGLQPHMHWPVVLEGMACPLWLGGR